MYMCFMFSLKKVIVHFGVLECFLSHGASFLFFFGQMKKNICYLLVASCCVGMLQWQKKKSLSPASSS